MIEVTAPKELKKCERCLKIIRSKGIRWCSQRCSKLGLKALYKKRKRLFVNGYNRSYKGNMRTIAFKKSGGRCKTCTTTKNLTINHIIPKVVGGKNKIDNFEVMCLSCNIKEYQFLVKRALKFYFQHHDS